MDKVWIKWVDKRGESKSSNLEVGVGQGSERNNPNDSGKGSFKGGNLKSYCRDNIPQPRAK